MLGAEYATSSLQKWGMRKHILAEATRLVNAPSLDLLQAVSFSFPAGIESEERIYSGITQVSRASNIPLFKLLHQRLHVHADAPSASVTVF
jgi:hypothetical protein